MHCSFKKEKILLLADESETIRIANVFFDNHPFVDVQWNSLREDIDIVQDEFAIIIIGAENINNNYDLVFSTIKKVRQIDSEVNLILITDDDSIIMDSRLLEHSVDDLLLFPFKVYTFGFRILINLTRYRKNKNISIVANKAKQKYEKSLGEIHAIVSTYKQSGG